MTRPPVELRPAYAWDCEDCGRENFHRGMALLEGLADFVAMPTQVICIYCGAVYGTVHWREQGEGHGR